jgi:hypothetical protein
MRVFLFTVLLNLLFFPAIAGRISGTVTDDKGNIMPYASILVKGTTIGTTANIEGKYFLTLIPGQYTIVCQYVGFTREEKKITVTEENLTLNFKLSQQKLSLAEVVVRPGAEDPAYDIIRNAIKKRPYYRDQLDKFQCEVYTKGQFQLRDYPTKIFGQKVEFDDGDTSKRKMLYLAETIAKYSVEMPHKTKIEVISTKVSGDKNAFGFSAPQIISFYENNIEIGGLNPRGFVSPVASGALSFYKYKYEGSFFEDGKEINKIKVIPKRSYEPLFSGYINITEGDWRIHSVQLILLKTSQMQLLDTLRVDQLYVPYNNDVWVVKSQVLYPSIKLFGFDAFGSFVNIYSKFDITPAFTKKSFGNTIIKYLDSSNKKPSDYWDSIRPVPLRMEEIADYKKKDSLEQAHKDPHYLDSMDRKQAKVGYGGFALAGIQWANSKKREYYTIDPIAQSLSFNPAEGTVLNLSGSYSKVLDSNNRRQSILFSPTFRYGFSNKHFNSWASFTYFFGKKYFSSITLQGGKRVFQYNNNNPINSYQNTWTSLLWGRNYMKTYEAWFGKIDYTKSIGEGLVLNGSISYQDRMPLDNTTNYKWNIGKSRVYTPNFPEIMAADFTRHQALVIHAMVTWRPVSRYIEFPDRKISLGSKAPVLSLSYTAGIKNLLGSDVSYSKWNFDISDNVNLKLGGLFRYRITVGGFLNRDKVQVPDFTHFDGNQVIFAGEYLHSFQLLPYYKYSNDEYFYTTAHIEHHFNGLLTNKVPGFKKINWYLVVGGNAFYINKQQRYAELFAGLENILKIIRVDWIWGFENQLQPRNGFRVSITGITGRKEK